MNVSGGTCIKGFGCLIMIIDILFLNFAMASKRASAHITVSNRTTTNKKRKKGRKKNRHISWQPILAITAQHEFLEFNREVGCVRERPVRMFEKLSKIIYACLYGL